MHLVAAQGLTMARLVYYQVSLAQGRKPVKSSAHLKMGTVAGWIAECHGTYFSASGTSSAVSSFFKTP